MTSYRAKKSCFEPIAMFNLSLIRSVTGRFEIRGQHGVGQDLVIQQEGKYYDHA